MEQELENLKHERRALEMHIARTQKWIDHVGHWRVHVYDASVRREIQAITDVSNSVGKFDVFKDAVFKS